MDMIKAIKKWFKEITQGPCPNCKGRLKYTADVYVGYTCISVWTCESCKKQYV